MIAWGEAVEVTTTSARSSSSGSASKEPDEPPARVRDLDATDRHARLSLLRELFGLEEAAAADADEAAEVRRLHG